MVEYTLLFFYFEEDKACAGAGQCDTEQSMRDRDVTRSYIFFCDGESCVSCLRMLARI
jgi:hypothetical protein